jgi:hypothetical protein
MYSYAKNTISSARNTGIAALGGLALLLGIGTMAGCPTTPYQDDDDDTTGYQDDDDTADDDDTTGDDDDSTPGNEAPTLYSLIFEVVDGDNVVQVKDDEGQDVVYEGDRVLVTAEYGDDVSPIDENLPGSYTAHSTIGSRTIDIIGEIGAGNFQDCSNGSTCSAYQMDDDEFHVVLLQNNLVRISYINEFPAGTLGANLFVNDGTYELDEIDSLEIRAKPELVEGSIANYIVDSPNEPVSVPYVGEVTDVRITNGPDWIEASVGNGVIDLSSDAPDNSFYDCSEDSPCSLELEVEDEKYISNGSVSVVVTAQGELEFDVHDWKDMNNINGNTYGTQVTIDNGSDTQLGYIDSNGAARSSEDDGPIRLNESGIYTVTVHGVEDGHSRVEKEVEVNYFPDEGTTEVADGTFGVIPEGYALTSADSMTDLLIELRGAEDPLYGLPDSMRNGTEPVSIDTSGNAAFDQVLEDVIFPYVDSLGIFPVTPEIVADGTGIVNPLYSESPGCPPNTYIGLDVVNPGGIRPELDFEDDQNNYVILFHEMFGHGVFGVEDHIEENGVMDSNPHNGDGILIESVANDVEEDVYRVLTNMKGETLEDYAPIE